MKQLRLILFVLLSTKALAQDAQPLTLPEAEKQFLQNNLLLLAQRYHVDADEALVEQARKWNNPSFSTTLGFGTLNKVQPFNIGSGGQFEGNIDQLILLAGKRNKQVQLAQWNAASSAAAFNELMRTLRLQLRSSYYQLYFLKETEKTLREQLGNLQKILDAYREADSKGSVAHADVIRLQALQVGISNDYTDLRQQELAASLNLQTLLGSPLPVTPVVGGDVLQQYTIGSYTLQSLTDTALANRPDLALAGNQLQMARVNYKLQKALAVPDLHLGATYDKNGSYAANFVGLTLGIDLPLWNRNKGNIKAAAGEMKAQDALFQQQRLNVSAEVANALEKIRFLENGSGWPDLKSFNTEYEQLIAEVAANFRKGNISLLQFIDYFNSYSDHVKHTNKFLNDRVLAYEELNYTTGTQLFNTVN
ncbi:TolC family protein [Chitinophaga sp. YIM B06452]|uniref:TolC family protein n=1 Tax=Chitinophaga sp. YIM B06452 TaxID=3082158 RepID=UPI0031FE6CD5